MTCPLLQCLRPFAPVPTPLMLPSDAPSQNLQRAQGRAGRPAEDVLQELSRRLGRPRVDSAVASTPGSLLPPQTEGSFP